MGSWETSGLEDLSYLNAISTAALESNNLDSKMLPGSNAEFRVTEGKPMTELV